MEDFKIKPELKDEFAKVVGKSCLDPYSFGVVEATIKVISALDKGKTVDEANNEMYGMGISGFMAGCVAEWVSKFHERGDEFRIYWNTKWGVDEAEAKGGVVNPAIVTINN